MGLINRRFIEDFMCAVDIVFCFIDIGWTALIEWLDSLVLIKMSIDRVKGD